MGYIYKELIGPALVFDHPGVTKSEFAGLLDEVSNPASSYPRGVTHLAELLGLQETEQFAASQKARKDEKGAFHYPPMQDHQNELIILQRFTKVEGEKVVKLRRAEGHIVVGEDVIVDWDTELDGRVLEIIDQEPAGVEFEGEEDEMKMNLYTLRTLLWRVNTVRHPYSSLDELYASWPQFAPENKYDFSQERGGFEVRQGIAGAGRERFLWMQKEGKYYLDPETLNRIPAGKSQRVGNPEYDYGYVDLVLTAQAIKEREWKILYHDAAGHAFYLLQKSPEAYKRYEKAVMDTWVSEHATSNGLTHNDLLRLRLDMGLKPSRRER